MSNEAAQATPGNLDFWFDYSCPYAYLASTSVEALAARTGSKLTLEPMLLGAVFKAVATPQNLSEVLNPAKRRHNELDMARWAERWGVPLNKPAGHPMRTVEALRATLACGASKIDPKVMHGFFRAYWVEGRELSDRATIRDVVARAGHDADAVLARLDDDAIKNELRARTERAIERGIFGAPAFIVRKRNDDRGELYWGQDRMHFVERALGSAPAPTPKRTPSRPHTLEVYWDFSSPFSYLGLTRVEALAKRTGAKLELHPMLLGAVFKAIGTADAPMLTWSQAKRSYYAEDMIRWAAHWNVPFRWPSRFPMNTVKALRCYLALPEERRAAFRDATYRALWSEDRDISDDAVLAELIGEGAGETLARTQTKEIKNALFAATERAVSSGVFGAPTFVVDGEHLFWGQDRLELVEAALLR
jgi:2-hydroxychromene-2-carboxylate isomerase